MPYSDIVIPLYYDLSIRNWTTTAGGQRLQPNLILGQSDSVDFDVKFVRDGVVVELTQTPVWIFTIKPIGQTTATALVELNSANQSGSGTSTKYTFTASFTGPDLEAWLATVNATTNYAAICIRDSVNEIVTLPALTCTILPDYTL